MDNSRPIYNCYQNNVEILIAKGESIKDIDFSTPLLFVFFFKCGCTVKERLLREPDKHGCIDKFYIYPCEKHKRDKDFIVNIK